MRSRSHNITALILAGGRGSRMGGVDKGLQLFRGQPLVAHVLERLAQQGLGIAHTFISANRSASEYAALGETFGATVLPDAAPGDFEGPLAGFLAGLNACGTPLLLIVPCDSPLIPLDLLQRLYGALQEHSADIAVACDPEKEASGAVSVRAQPVFCLLKVSLKNNLNEFLRGGGRKIDAWTAQHAVTHVAFNLPQDDPQAFLNINTLAELQALE